MATISRHRIAQYVVDTLIDGASASDVATQVAAYLVDEHRERELDLIIREIYDLFEHRGVVVADVTTAHALDDALRASVKTLIGGEQVTLVEHLDPSVLGGIKIETPSKQLDATLARRLVKLRESKIG